MSNPLSITLGQLFSRFRGDSGADAPKTRPHTLSEGLREDGLIAGTIVSTLEGWRPVEAVAKGDVVVSFDNALQRVVNVHCVTIDPDTLPRHKRFLLKVPASVLGNREDILLLPAQEVALETDFAEAVYHDPFTLVPALLLEGSAGIERVAMEAPFTIHMLTFEQEQLLLVAGMALVACRNEADFSPLAMAKGVDRADYARLSTEALEDIVAAWAKEKGRPPAGGRPVYTAQAAFPAARL